MQHVRIANYDITSGTFDDVARLARGGMLDVFRSSPGFIAYGVIQTGPKNLVSLTFWETREAAEAAVPAARTWVAEHVADLVTVTSNQVGDVGFLEGAALVTA